MMWKSHPSQFLRLDSCVAFCAQALDVVRAALGLAVAAAQSVWRAVVSASSIVASIAK